LEFLSSSAYPFPILVVPVGALIVVMPSIALIFVLPDMALMVLAGLMVIVTASFAVIVCLRPGRPMTDS